MFGTYRYCLALLVMFGHLHPLYGGRGLTWTGVYAVWGFFVLSGYLMARVLNEVYTFSARGICRFLLNRFLRIYPPYWVALALGIASVVMWPGLTAAVSKRHGALPSDVHSWLVNIGLFGLHPMTAPRLIGPAWSLHTELCFYVFLALGLARRSVAPFFLLASVAAALAMFLAEAPFGQRYSYLQGAALPFSVGVFVYHFPRRWPAPRWLGPGAGIAAVAHALLAHRIWSDPFGAGFYAGLPVYATATLGLSNASTRLGWLRGLDRFLGDLSYPLFLVHFPVMYALLATAYGGERAHGPGVFAAALLPSHIAAWAVMAGVEKPIEAVRNRIRGRAMRR